MKNLSRAENFPYSCKHGVDEGADLSRFPLEQYNKKGVKSDGKSYT